jgi:hypothetical protein
MAIKGNKQVVFEKNITKKINIKLEKNMKIKNKGIIT